MIPRMCGHRVLVKPDVLETETTSGIQLVLNEKLEQAAIQTGVLISSGPSAWKAFREVHEGKEVNGRPWAADGDKVIYSKYAGRHWTDEETEELYVFLNDEDVIAILPQEA